MSRKKQVCFTTEEKHIKRMEEIRDETGVPVSRQIEMKLLGYDIVKEDKKDFNNKIESYDIIKVSDDTAKSMIINYIKSDISISEIVEHLHLDLKQTSDIVSDLFSNNK